jgi:hypothetical protein
MDPMHYQLTRATAAIELASGDRDRISTALVRLALHDDDRPWLEQLLVQFMAHEDAWVRGWPPAAWATSPGCTVSWISRR